MSVIDNLMNLWQANGQQPHETQGAPQHVPHGTNEGDPHFDPLSAGASKAIDQVRKNIGYKKPSYKRPLVELLGNLGTAGLRSSDSLMAQEMGAQDSNPYAAEDAKVAQNMQIMQFLAEQEQARKIHEFKQQEAAQYQALQQQKLAQQAQHNQALEQHYSQRGASGAKQYAPTNLGKLYQERDRAIEAFGENSPQANSYDLAIQKVTTDTDTRKRTLFAANLEKTLKMVDTKILTQYSGPQGAIKLKMEQAADLAGNPSKEYLAYKRELGILGPAVGQVRQFLNDSSAKEAAAKLEHMTNPSSLGSSPEAAEHQLKATLQVFENELGTYHGGVTSTKEHTGRGNHHEHTESAPFASRSTESLMEELARLKGQK